MMDASVFMDQAMELHRAFSELRHTEFDDDKCALVGIGDDYIHIGNSLFMYIFPDGGEVCCESKEYTHRTGHYKGKCVISLFRK